MNKSRKHFAKLKKPITEDYIVYDSIGKVKNMQIYRDKK